VMGVYSKRIGESEFSVLPDSKYYDNYTSTTATSACNGKICYGHALSETSGWYSDTASFAYSSGPWFSRGGFNDSTSDAGMFFFGSNGGSSYAYSIHSFRVVLIGA